MGESAPLARVTAALRVVAGLASLGSDQVRLTVRGRAGRWVEAWALVGLGDELRPVVTVMVEGED